MLLTIILLILTYILNLIDYCQTMYAIQLFGLQIELNPIARWLFEHNCATLVKLIVPAITLVSLGFVVKADRKLVWAVYVLFTIYCLVVLHNFAMAIKAGILF